MIQFSAFFRGTVSKKGLLFLGTLLFVGVLWFFPEKTLAQVDVGLNYAASSGLPNTSPLVIVARIINIILALLGIITTVLIFYAGFLYLTSAGNEDKIDTAKEVISAAVIGLVLVLSSYTISRFALRSVYQSTTGNTYPTPYNIRQ